MINIFFALATSDPNSYPNQIHSVSIFHFTASINTDLHVLMCQPESLASLKILQFIIRLDLCMLMSHMV